MRVKHGVISQETSLLSVIDYLRFIARACASNIELKQLKVILWKNSWKTFPVGLEDLKCLFQPKCVTDSITSLFGVWLFVFLLSCEGKELKKLSSTPKHVAKIHDKANSQAITETNEVRLTVADFEWEKLRQVFKFINISIFLFSKLDKKMRFPLYTACLRSIETS